MSCGFGLVTALGEIANTKMKEHKDMQVVYSPLSDITQTRFVQTAAKDSQIAQAIENITDGLAVVNANMIQMQKSNLQYHRNTLKILNVKADHMLERTFSFDDLEDPDQGVPTDSNPPTEAQQQQGAEEAQLEKENVEEEEEEKEEEIEEAEEEEEEDIEDEEEENVSDDGEEEEEDYDHDGENCEEGNSEEENNETEEDNAKETEQDAGNLPSGHNTDAEDAETDTLGQSKKATEDEKMSAEINETNVSDFPRETNPDITNMNLTTVEVLVGLDPLATAPASPKAKQKASSSSAPSLVQKASPVLKPKKKVTKKARTANTEEPMHATESDVASEHLQIPPSVPKKRLRTKHPNVEDDSEAIPAATTKQAKTLG
ncbi:hypothetical protein COLO4_36855, partial [Corchorus olitorius]